MNRRWLLALGIFIGIAILAAVGRVWLDQQALPQETDPEVAELEYDFYSTGIQTVLFRPDGQVHFTLQAAHQVHYKDNTTVLTEPVIQLFEDSLLRWHITANSGRVTGGSSREVQVEVFELIDTVELAHTNDSGERMTLTTEFLSVDPNRETLTTELPVMLTSPGLVLTATGLFADLGSNELIFFSNLEGRYYETPNP